MYLDCIKILFRGLHLSFIVDENKDANQANVVRKQCDNVYHINHLCKDSLDKFSIVITEDIITLLPKLNDMFKVVILYNQDSESKKYKEICYYHLTLIEDVLYFIRDWEG